MRRYRNVFQAIAHEGHEESFVPVETDEFDVEAVVVYELRKAGGQGGPE